MPALSSRWFFRLPNMDELQLDRWQYNNHENIFLEFLSLLRAGWPPLRPRAPPCVWYSRVGEGRRVWWKSRTLRVDHESTLRVGRKTRKNKKNWCGMRMPPSCWALALLLGSLITESETFFSSYIILRCGVAVLYMKKK